MKKSKNKFFDDIEKGLQEALLFTQNKLEQPLKISMHKDGKVIQTMAKNYNEFLENEGMKSEQKDKKDENKKI